MMRSTVCENIELKLDKKVPSNSFCSVSRYADVELPWTSRVNKRIRFYKEES
jgi:hypothetical protein